MGSSSDNFGRDRRRPACAVAERRRGGRAVARRPRSATDREATGRDPGRDRAREQLKPCRLETSARESASTAVVASPIGMSNEEIVAAGLLAWVYGLELAHYRPRAKHGLAKVSGPAWRRKRARLRLAMIARPANGLSVVASAKIAGVPSPVSKGSPVKFSASYGSYVRTKRAVQNFVPAEFQAQDASSARWPYPPSRTGWRH